MGLGRQIDKAISNTKYLAEQVKKRDGFELVCEPEYTNCCFWYYPTSMRGSTPPDPHKLTKVMSHKDYPVFLSLLLLGCSNYQGPHGENRQDDDHVYSTES